jgi:NitT/TauT family transport system substrate-binding protein
MARRHGRHRSAVLAALLAGALVAASCGGNEDLTSGPGGGSSEGGGAGGAEQVEVVEVEGCEDGWTDPSDRSADRQVARCEPGAPAPQPLPERETVRLASAFRLEFNSPVLLAESMGEFDKENIEFEFVNLPFSDAVPQLAQGQVDAAIGGFELALYNGGNQGLPVKAVMGNYYPPDAGDYDVPQTGLWCRRDAFTNPEDPDPAETQDMVWASSVGRGSSSVYYSVTELRERVPEFDVEDLQVERIPSADTVQALQNGAIDCGVLLDPLWLQVADDPGYVMMATQTPGEPLGLVAFGKSLLQDRPEVGVAFTRAIIRTINTYFDGDYHQDPEVMAEIAEVTGQDTSRLTQTPSLVMDWEIREGTTDDMQELFIDLGVITEFSEPVPEEVVVDRSFYEAAVGHTG